MKKIIPIFMLLVFAVMISVSCKTTPDTKELNIAMEKAKASRQKVIDFEGPAYFPSEWESIESKFKEIEAMPLTTDVEVKEAENAYAKAAEAYDNIFARTVPLYAQAREDEIIATRETLVNSGFAGYFPEYLEEADKIAFTAQEQYKKGEYYEAKATAAKAMGEYETLLAGANVYLARQEILDRGFAQYDADNFSKADALSKAAIDDYEAGRRDAAVEKAEESLLRYNLILTDGWTSYAKERQNLAAAERQRAINEKTNIASRDLFRDAEVSYSKAEEFVANKNIKEAALQYTEAEAMFAIARKDTAEKKERAASAIKTAEEKVDASNEAAQEANRLIN